MPYETLDTLSCAESGLQSSDSEQDVGTTTLTHFTNNIKTGWRFKIYLTYKSNLLEINQQDHVNIHEDKPYREMQTDALTSTHTELFSTQPHPKNPEFIQILASLCEVTLTRRLRIL